MPASLFGECLKRLRQSRGWTQEEMAEKLNTSKQVISRYETGQRSPKITVAAVYAEKLGVSLSELNGTEDLREPAENDGLDEEFISTYQSMTDEQKKLIIDVMKSFAKQK